MDNIAFQNIPRKESWEKVTGQAQYIGDLPMLGVLSARLLTSTCAHGKITRLDISKASKIQGVLSIITGKDINLLFGPLLKDRPALAVDVVRYSGEPLAIVVATDIQTAELAVNAIEVEYEELPIMLRPLEALKENAFLIHKHMEGYKKVLSDIYPVKDTNISSSYQIKKVNVFKAIDNSKFIVKKSFYLPPSAHLAMERREAQAEITASGYVIINTSSQAPYSVQKQISSTFNIEDGKVIVKVPFVGGAFGGKAPVILEILAYIASKSLGGKPVRLTISREQDINTTPCRIGLEANIELAANEEGIIQAVILDFWLDSGAYTDIAPYMTKAIAVDCTGPYNIENVLCNAYCVYTNHTFATSYRSFAHESYTFCIERTLDILAKKCKIDPLEIRLRNAIKPGHLTPGKTFCTSSLIGNLPKCIDDIKTLSNWSNQNIKFIEEDIVQAKGISCFWKTENPPTNAISGAIITFNHDGSVNLNTGVSEIGSGGHTYLAQLLAEKLKINIDQIHVTFDVNTHTAPEHWKTVASLTGYLAGNAVLNAGDDVIYQLKINASKVFECEIEELEIKNSMIYRISEPSKFIHFKDIAKGYKTSGGVSIGDPVIGRGGFMLKGLSLLDPKTGQGKTGPAWTLGAQVVEIEANLKTLTYRVISASTVIDIGNAINPELMRAMIAGGMSMGISMSSREAYKYDKDGIIKTPNLRTYKLMHIGQEPDYRVSFVETAQEDSPYGVRSYSEHGIIGIPAALGNALSLAFSREISSIPMTPELIWSTKERDSNDTI